MEWGLNKDWRKEIGEPVLGMGAKQGLEEGKTGSQSLEWGLNMDWRLAI